MIWFTWRQFRLPALAGLGAARAPPTAASGGMNGCHAWLESQNLTQRTIYLGADKFWVLQWRELGVLLVASALLAAFCFWWIRRRVT